MKVLIILIFSFQSLAWGSGIECAFENSFVFGASISSGYGSPLDLKEPMTDETSMSLDNPHQGSNTNPTERAAQLVTGLDEPSISNTARIAERGVGSYVTNPVIDLSRNPNKITNHIDPKTKEFKLPEVCGKKGITEDEKYHCDKIVFSKQAGNVLRTMNKASIWVGIDAYYWETIPPQGLTETVKKQTREKYEKPLRMEALRREIKNPLQKRMSLLDIDREVKSKLSVLSTSSYDTQMRVQCGKAAGNVYDLVNHAQKMGKPLVLGTVPYDNKKEHISTLVKQFWSPPYAPCVDLVNKALRDTCKPDKQCYLVDLKELGRDLTDGDGLTFDSSSMGTSEILTNGRNYGPKDFRFDGIHLSKEGVEYVALSMIKKLKANPPRCAQEGPIAMSDSDSVK